MCTHKHLCVYFSSLHDFFFTHVCVLKCYPAPSLLSLNNTPLRSFLMGTWILTFYTFANYSTERINQAVFSFIVVKYTWHKTYHFKHFKMYNSFFFLIFFIYLFIYSWLCWVLASVRGLSPVVASGGHSSSRCAGLSLSRPLLLRSTGSRRAGSVIVAHGPSRSAACGILPDQVSNPCPLH